MSTTTQNKAFRILTVIIIGTLPLTAGVFLFGHNPTLCRIGELRISSIDLLVISIAANALLVVWRIIEAIHLRNRI